MDRLGNLRGEVVTLTAHFNLALARIQPLGYRRCVMFSQAPDRSTVAGLIPSKPNGGDSDSRPSGAEALGDAALSPDSKRGRKPNTMYRNWQAEVQSQSLSFGKRAERQLRFVIMEES